MLRTSLVSAAGNLLKMFMPCLLCIGLVACGGGNGNDTATLSAASNAVTMANIAVVQDYAYISSLGNGSGQFQFGGSGPVQLAQAVAVDPVSHNIFVADYGNNRVQIFNSAGSYQSDLGTPSSGQFQGPRAVAVDPTSRNIVVLDSNGTEGVGHIFNSAGVSIGLFGNADTGGAFGGTAGLAIDPANHNIVVADVGNFRLAIFDSSGTYLSTVFLPRFAPGAIPYPPRGVAIDAISHNIVVSFMSQNSSGSSFTSVVMILNSDGLPLVSVVAPNTGFNQAIGIAIDQSTRNIITADYGNNRVTISDSTGAALSQFGTVGSGNGQFQGPQAVAVDPTSHNIVVADFGNNRVQIFAPVGPPPPPPIASLSTVNLAFPDTILGSTSTALSVTVTNSGNANLVISSVDIIGSGFQFTQNTCAGVTLLSGSVCYLTLNFKPTTVGSYTATVTIVSNDSHSPQLIQIVGTGVSSKSAVIISSITPTVGQGGTTILITGKTFGDVQGTSFVSVGGLIAKINNWSKNKIEAVAPLNLVGVVNLMVVTPGGISNTIGFTYASLGTPVWQKLKGPWSRDCEGTFGAITIHPTNPNLIYIGSSAGCGLYASANGGTSWSPINEGVIKIGIPPHYAPISKIVIAPNNPNVIYFGTFVNFGPIPSGHLYKSIDRGFTWTDISGTPSIFFQSPPIHSPVLDIAVNPVDANMVYVSVVGDGVYKTNNGGQNWMQVVAGAGVLGASDDYTTIKIASSNPNVVYLTGFTNYSGNWPICSAVVGDCLGANGAFPIPLLKSVDGGTTWARVNNPFFIAPIVGSFATLITDLAIDPFSDGKLYASTMAYQTPLLYVAPNKGIFNSTDGGVSWHDINGTVDSALSQSPIFGLVMNPNDANTLLAISGKPNSAFKSVNGGGAWVPLNVLGLQVPTNIHSLAFAGQRLYTTTSQGLYVLDGF